MCLSPLGVELGGCKDYPFWNIIMYWNWKAWGRQTYVPTDFFVENLIVNNFYLKYFLLQSINLAAFNPEVNFLISEHYNIPMEIFGAPSSTSGGDKHIRPLTFCRNFNFEQFLFDVFFDIIGIFGIFSPTVTFFSFYCIIIFQTWQSFKQASQLLSWREIRHMRP